MERIGILCACEAELAPFLPHIEDGRTETRMRLVFHLGKLCGVPAVLAYCGVCKVNAALAAKEMIAAYGVDAIINAGTAGGIAPEVALFDTVVSTQAAYHDVADGILTEFLPRLPSIWFEADPVLLSAARRAANGKSKVCFGKMVTGEQFITDAHREALSLRLAPLCVDMETAGIAHACFIGGVSFIAVRSITDTAKHEGIGCFEQNCARASQLSKNFVLELLRELNADEPA